MPFNEIIGQERAVDMLRRAIKRNRVASSYLFTGEQGIGKRFTALQFAQTVNCHAPVDNDSCGSCGPCRKLSGMNHPDFTLIEPEGGMIKVEHIRNLKERFSLRAHEGGYKVAIVDDADTMNISAANAFLKTLEEPAPKSLIILVSSSPDQLPETIRSRCLRVNFRPLSDEHCKKVIRKKSKHLDQLVRLAMGRPGLAVSQDLVRRRDSFMNSVNKMLGQGSKHPWKDKEDLRKWIDMALLLMRDMAVLTVTGSGEKTINRDRAEEISALCGNSTLKGIIESYEKLVKLRDGLVFNPGRPVTWNYITSIMETL